MLCLILRMKIVARLIFNERVNYVKCSKNLNTFLFLFSNTIILIFSAGIHKMDVRKANRDQAASSDLGVCCLSVDGFGRQLVFEILEH